MIRSTLSWHLVRYASIATCIVLVNVPLHGQTFQIVNMVPLYRSTEFNQNSEPFIAVHPTASGVLVATSTKGPQPYCSSTRRSAVYVSVDDGDSWDLACIVPKFPDAYPMDPTVQFSADGNVLYIGALQLIVSAGTATGYVYAYQRPAGTSTVDWIASMTSATSGPSAVARFLDTDQPHLRAMTAAGSRGIVVGSSVFSMYKPIADLTHPCDQSTGVVSFSADPIATPWSTTSANDLCIAFRPSVGDPPSTPAVRSAVHSNGTIYALFYRPVVEGEKVDVVVVRNDGGDKNRATAFQYLKDLPVDPPGTPGPLDTSEESCAKRDGFPGYRVKRCVEYPWGLDADDFGQQRRFWTELSIAVDPSNSQIVVICWAESDGTSELSLHFARSTDGGVTWKDVPAPIANATNPALAIASDGAIGLLYQRLKGKKKKARWQTFFAFLDPAAGPTGTRKLADVRAWSPPLVQPPYLGDYIQLHARGKNFYGVFSASNDLKTSSFDPSLVVQRAYLGGRPIDPATGHKVPVSIDPYFVRVIR